MEPSWSSGDLERGLTADKKANIKDYANANKALRDARDQIIKAVDTLYPLLASGVVEDLRSTICLLEKVANFANALAVGEEERPSARMYARNRDIIQHLCLAWVAIIGEIPGTSRNAYESNVRKS